MDRRSFLKGAAGACVCGSCGGSVAEALAGEGAHWTYEGAGGPKEWGMLSPEYAACSMGREQSPVDLSKPVAAILGDPVTAWRPVPLRVQNNGHTIQVDCAGGGHVMLDGVQYDLIQFHFHHPSEHSVGGAFFDMECHFVHKAADGSLAVLGVMIAKGAADPTIEAVWQAMPAKAGESVTANGMLDPSRLLPKDPVTFRYAGSLTTPPCSEVVQWVVFRQAITASAEQLAAFAKMFPNNARPVQPLHRRRLLLDVM